MKYLVLKAIFSTNGTIYFSYSHARRELPSLERAATEVFHTRQISYPVMVTVYHMLECHGMDILPFPSYISDKGDRALKTEHGEIFSVDDEGSWCLFSIEVRNTYGLPFDVAFERTQEGWS